MHYVKAFSPQLIQAYITVICISQISHTFDIFYFFRESSHFNIVKWSTEKLQDMQVQGESRLASF